MHASLFNAISRNIASTRCCQCWRTKENRFPTSNSIHDAGFLLPGGRGLPASVAAAAHGLAGRPAEVFCQARDTLSHDVRECRRGLTLTVCRAVEALHLRHGALLMHSVFFLSNPARLAPANAPAKHIIMHSDAFRTTWRAHVRCSQVRTSGVRDGADARDFSCTATIGAIESEFSRSPRRACIRGTVS